MRVKAFIMSEAAVTVGEFRTFVIDTGYRTEVERGDGCVVFVEGKWQKARGIDRPSSGFSQGDFHPATCVSWNDDRAYIAWLNSIAGTLFRLPTEVEWEYAAKTGDGAEVSVDLAIFAWFEGNSDSSTHPVRQKRPNAYGLYDMIGNVWEWCSDWYGDCSSSPQAKPHGPETGSQRINWEGAWYGANWGFRTRGGKNTPDDRGNGLGFRLAHPLPHNRKPKTISMVSLRVRPIRGPHYQVPGACRSSLECS